VSSPSKNLIENLYVGISGLLLPVPKYQFPEAHKSSSRLTYYSTFFNSIEINSTFYKLPMSKTVEKWTQSVPKDFRFTFKLWKEITHAKNLEFKEDDVVRFFETISAARKKIGCILIQFPPSLGKSNILQLRALLECIEGSDKVFSGKIAIEFRNKSWYHEDVYELIEEYKAALVIHDIPKSATPSIDHTSEFIYVRFHGPTGNYRDSYSESFLHEYATYVNDWLKNGKTVYVYFNNTMGDAFQNAQMINRFSSGMDF
jgi:uncharacterized protein YecE (DUF72 family)